MSRAHESLRILLCYSTDLPEAQGVRVTKDGSDDSSWNNEDGSADSTGESEWFTWIILMTHQENRKTDRPEAQCWCFRPVLLMRKILIPELLGHRSGCIRGQTVYLQISGSIDWSNVSRYPSRFSRPRTMPGVRLIWSEKALTEAVSKCPVLTKFR